MLTNEKEADIISDVVADNAVKIMKKNGTSYLIKFLFYTIKNKIKKLLTSNDKHDIISKLLLKT